MLNTEERLWKGLGVVVSEGWHKMSRSIIYTSMWFEAWAKGAFGEVTAWMGVVS